MKNTVAGIGYVGLSLAVLFAQKHEVAAITTTPDRGRGHQTARQLIPGGPRQLFQRTGHVRPGEGLEYQANNRWRVRGPEDRYALQQSQFRLRGTHVLFPWIGVITALSVSLILTRMSIMTRLGRFLIG